jgi:hypothetical protein
VVHNNLVIFFGNTMGHILVIIHGGIAWLINTGSYMVHSDLTVQDAVGRSGDT